MCDDWQVARGCQPHQDIGGGGSEPQPQAHTQQEEILSSIPNYFFFLIFSAMQDELVNYFISYLVPILILDPEF